MCFFFRGMGGEGIFFFFLIQCDLQVWYPTEKRGIPFLHLVGGLWVHPCANARAELPPGPDTYPRYLTSPSRERPKLKEARHVPEDFAGRCIMKASLRRCAEKPLCNVLFDILVERLE